MGKPRYGDKTPGFVQSLPLLGRLFPEARFVHVIRDGRDVALSLLDRSWGPRSISEAARYWAARVTMGHRDGTALGPARYLEVSYEDLVRDPESVRQSVCSFIELDFATETASLDGAVERLPAERRKHHEHLGEPIQEGIRDWRRDMPVPDVAVFEAIAGRDLERFGYGRSVEHLPIAVRVRAAAERLPDRAASLSRRMKRTLRQRKGSRGQASAT
jgi:hypothetical protein